LFNFLNSAVLIAAAATLIPLLIHLFSRRKVKVVPFSSLKHLKEMQKRQVRRIKIRQLLLLILRMLIILIAVLAFARPATKGGYIGSHAGVSSVILLDRSASMQRQLKDGRLFELATQKLSEILEGFDQTDEVILIPFDRTSYFPSGERFFSSDIAEDILKQVTCGHNTADPGQAFQKGLELLRQANNLNKEIYFITDRQANSLPENRDTLPDKVSCYIIDLPTEIDGNCGIVDISMGGQLIEVGSEFIIKADIKNYDARAKTELLASLFVNDIRVMQKEFAIKANGSQSLQLKHIIQKPGFHSGWIELSDDDFAVDNRFYFSFRIPENFAVLIIDGDGGGEIIKLALVPSEEVARYWSVKTVNPQNLAAVRYNDYDLVILSGPDSLGKAETSRLLNFIDAGGGLFFILGDNTDTGYFNREFGSILGTELLLPTPRTFSGAGYYTLERFDYSHPIFKPFAALHDELPTLKFYSLAEIRRNSAENNIAYFSNGNPAIFESGFGLGRIVFMASPILPKYTDLAGHSFFVPFIIRTAEYLAEDISSYEHFNYVGQNIIRTVSDKISTQKMTQMVTPDDKTFQLAGIQKPGQLAFDCRPIDQPGIYQLKSNNRVIDIFSVNVAPEEGNLQAADLEHWAASLGISRFKTIPLESDADKIITETRYGRELWKIFLWAVVVLLIVEMIFSREKTVAEE